ncbi:MAG: glycosyltransferase family 8 protein [Lachnospiraceae bacterium]
MNIFYTTDERFVGKIAASICSVFENNRDMEQITVYIICQEVSADSKQKFVSLGEQYNRSVQVIDLKPLDQYFDFSFDTNGWAPIVLARLLVGKLLPESVERVLYMDGDTVNIGSLQKLWNTDLHGKVLGACIEATIDEERKRSLDMEGYPYINAGVLLFDLKKWREEQWGEQIIAYYREHFGRLFANDQDAINGALKDEIYYLEPKYNFYNIYWFYPYRVLKKLMGQTYYYSRDVVGESIQNPAIIHYLGEERPWRKGNTHKFRSHYEKYHDMTPWKDEPLEEGWKLYFICWNIFNKVMIPFPMLRYQIINRLIPVFMKWRKRQLSKK